MMTWFVITVDKFYALLLFFVLFIVMSQWVFFKKDKLFYYYDRLKKSYVSFISEE